ncbi:MULTISPECIES: hypothetical protein [unclassified Nocardioides]|uniref:hypothetical protein n=1 Tax=unclassified Nocardioides TaxID=2615069 RepID=UPI0012E3E318|nr:MULTISPECIES: hypothetical protein [unclassified Nocardioides]
MGIETSKALRARRRECVSQIDRLITRADERSPLGSVRRARVKDAARRARRRHRALASVRQSAAALEIEIGQALLDIVDHGLSQNDAYELVGLSRHLGRRYVDLARVAQGQVRAASSTGQAAGLGSGPTPADLGPNGTHPDAVPERKL